MARYRKDTTRTPHAADRRAAMRAALRLTIIYAVAALLWILLSDQALGALGLPRDLVLLLESVKGFLFVVVTAAAVFFMAFDALRTIQSSDRHYRALFDSATEGIALYAVARDASSRPLNVAIDDVNHALTELLGTPRERLIGLSVSPGEEPGEEARNLGRLVMRAVQADAPLGEEIDDPDNDTYRLASAFRIDEDLWALSVVDVTETRRAQAALREEDERIRHAYVDVLDAVTGGRLVLLTEQELDGELGEPLDEPQRLKGPERLAQARAYIRHTIKRRFPESDVGSILMNPVGEALNNVLKHAGTGDYQVFTKTDGTVQVVISDEGAGIDFRTLPRATLVSGFSTASTLGVGFSIMLQICDRVLLVTRPGRTIVVLEAHAHPAAENPEAPAAP